MPFFPTKAGKPASKKNIVALVIDAAGKLKLILISEDGRDAFGGHVFRVTGARHPARIGIELRIIGLLARHQSNIILTYAQEAPLEVLTETYLATKAALRDVASSSSQPALTTSPAIGNERDLDEKIEEYVKSRIKGIMEMIYKENKEIR